jgi:hypothetical protein
LVVERVLEVAVLTCQLVHMVSAKNLSNKNGANYAPSIISGRLSLG